jgi:hypothetical protein
MEKAPEASIDRSPEAVAERRADIENMSRHNDLEGLPPLSTEAQAIQDRLIAGEITSEQAVEEFKQLYTR